MTNAHEHHHDGSAKPADAAVVKTIERADLIVVLDQGRIVERGRHAELLENKGVYAKLQQLQGEASAGASPINPAIK